VPELTRITPVQSLVGQLYGFGPEDTAKLSAHLLEESIADYSNTLLGEAFSAGYDASYMAIRDVLVLQRLEERAEFAAQSIARTYNQDVMRQVQVIARDVPSANRFTYAKRLESWDKERMVGKIDQVAVTESGFAMSEARKDFLGRNPGLGAAVARVVPDSFSEPFCGELVELGEMPIDQAMDIELPAHVGCIHSLEIAWACDTAAEKAWAEGLIQKGECPPPEELWMAGGEAEGDMGRAVDTMSKFDEKARANDWHPTVSVPGGARPFDDAWNATLRTLKEADPKAYESVVRLRSSTDVWAGHQAENAKAIRQAAGDLLGGRAPAAKWAEHARTFLDATRQARVNEELQLFRGMNLRSGSASRTFLEQARVGSTIDLGLASTTNRAAHAGEFALGKGQAVMMQIDSAASVPLRMISPTAYESEHLVSGRFLVTAVETSTTVPGTFGQSTLVVHLKQVGKVVLP